MFTFYNLNFFKITKVDEKPVQQSAYMPFLKDVRSDYATIDFTATYLDIEIADVVSDVVIRTEGIPPYSSGQSGFEQYNLLPIGSNVLRNTIRVLHYNNLILHKNEKYILNFYPILGQFVTAVEQVLEDGTDVKDIYFEIIEQLTTSYSSATCLYIFKCKDVSSLNTLTMVCRLQSGGTKELRFNINE